MDANLLAEMPTYNRRGNTVAIEIEEPHRPAGNGREFAVTNVRSVDLLNLSGSYSAANLHDHPDGGGVACHKAAQPTVR